MEFKHYPEASFVASAVSCVLLVVMLTTRTPGPSTSTTAMEYPSTDSPGLHSLLQELQSANKRSNAHLLALEAKLDKLQHAVDQTADAPSGDTEEGLELHTEKDAKTLIGKLGKSPTPEKYAEVLAIVDGWVSAPERADEFQRFKVGQVKMLRQLVKKDIELLHMQALKADTGTKASELHARASQSLALYPMDSTKSVLDEARSLSSKHSEVGVRIDVIRRQRYNAWAMTRIEETIKAINSIASSFKTSDNPKTIDATVKHLGEIDPLLLEPVVAQLYNYAVEQAKSNISAEQQLALGRQMIDPAIKRKGYGDF